MDHTLGPTGHHHCVELALLRLGEVNERVDIRSRVRVCGSTEDPVRR
jgi:hypothetical protein